MLCDICRHPFCLFYYCAEVQKVLSGGQLKTADGDVMDMAAIDTSVRDDPQYQGVNALIVSNIPENVSKADIKLFFENRKLSGSSEVSCIFMRQDKAAVVSFSSHKGTDPGR